MTKNPESSKIIGVQFSILSADEIRKQSVAHITSRDTFINGKPVIGGLFDPRMGVLDPGFICPTDGHNYIDSPGYFGHMELAKPVYYIQYINTILKVLRCVCIKCSKLLINKDAYNSFLEMSNEKKWNSVFAIASKVKRCGDNTHEGCGCKQPIKIKKEGLSTIFAEWEIKDTSDPESTGNVNMKLTPEMVLKIFRRISDEDVNFMGFSSIFSRPDWMICQVLAVPPPAVRPSVKHDAQQRSEDDLSHILVNIISKFINVSGGVRMTGGGFGGCVVALLPASSVEGVRQQIESQYPYQTGLKACIYLNQPTRGVETVQGIFS